MHYSSYIANKERLSFFTSLYVYASTEGLYFKRCHLTRTKTAFEGTFGQIYLMKFQDENIAIPYNVGETVKVVDGPFNGFDGTIEKVTSYNDNFATFMLYKLYILF